MREQLLKQLRILAEEEILVMQKKNEERVRRGEKIDETDFNVDSKKYLPVGKHITANFHGPNLNCPHHGHNYIEIMYVCSGHVVHVIDGKELCMAAGDILFMNQNVRHSILKTGDDDIAINFIILPEFFDIPLVMLKEDRNNVLADFLISTLRINESRPQYLHFKTADNYAIGNIMENIIESLIQNKHNMNINQFSMGLVFLHLLDNIEAISGDSFQSGYDVVGDTVLQYINHNYKNASLHELASSMYQSQSNMSKIIKKSTGYSFSELLQRKRFQQAVMFLMDTNMTIAEIINAVGYENSSFFYRRFRTQYGMSPRDYRMNQSDKAKIRL